MNTNEIPMQAIANPTVFDSYVKAKSVLGKYDNVMCSISGGADSDIMLDLCTRLDADKRIRYLWFDTGLEYQATKRHLKDLEERYGVTIEPFKAVKSVPLSCRTYGQPFLSKRVSEYIYRLQLHGFQFEDDSFENLIRKYPNCRSALAWWCNQNNTEEPAKSPCNIARIYGLKEFLTANPPKFRIAARCCDYAKKSTAHKAQKGADLAIVGVRKAEGGARATAHKACFSAKDGGTSEYRPLFWYKNADKEFYEDAFQIEHSECYSVYGLKRTGCVGCPYGKNLEDELEAAGKYEPMLYRACMNVFKDTYEYTKAFREFRKEYKAGRNKGGAGVNDQV